MPKKDYTLKCEITQNGSTIDNPMNLSIRKRGKSAGIATMTYPNKYGRFQNYFASSDIIRIYLGLDELEDIPILTGKIYEQADRDIITLNLADMLTIANQDEVVVDAYDNQDGVEAARAIQYYLAILDLSMYATSIDTSGIQGTNPKVVLNSSFRKTQATKILKVINEITSLCWDDTEYPKSPRGYTYWMQDNRFNFRKMQRPAEATPVISFNNVDDLLSSKPASSLMPTITKATVKGAAYTDGYGNEKNYEGTFELESASKSLGLQHRTFFDESITTNWECKRKAERIVMNSRVKNVTSSISVPNLFSAIPEVTGIYVDDSKYGLSGNHLLSELTINIGGGQLACNATLNNADPVLTDIL